MNMTSSIVRATFFSLFLLFAGLLAYPALADSGRLIERISDELELEPGQRAEIEALIEAHRSRMQALGLDPETRREGRAERYALMQEIQAVLSPQQLEQWRQSRDLRRGQFQRQRARNRLRQTLESMDLEDVQRASIEALVRASRQRGREERAAFMLSLQEILTPEQWSQIEENSRF